MTRPSLRPSSSSRKGSIRTIPASSARHRSSPAWRSRSWRHPRLQSSNTSATRPIPPPKRRSLHLPRQSRRSLASASFGVAKPSVRTDIEGRPLVRRSYDFNGRERAPSFLASAGTRRGASDLMRGGRHATPLALVGDAGHVVSRLWGEA